MMYKEISICIKYLRCLKSNLDVAWRFFCVAKKEMTKNGISIKNRLRKQREQFPDILDIFS